MNKLLILDRIIFDSKQYLKPFKWALACLKFYLQTILILKGFQTIDFIFIVIFHNVSADISSSFLQVFVELGNLYGTSN